MFILLFFVITIVLICGAGIALHYYRKDPLEKYVSSKNKLLDVPAAAYLKKKLEYLYFEGFLNKDISKLNIYIRKNPGNIFHLRGSFNENDNSNIVDGYINIYTGLIAWYIKDVEFTIECRGEISSIKENDTNYILFEGNWNKENVKGHFKFKHKMT
jgi:hypothetical protein